MKIAKIHWDEPPSSQANQPGPDQSKSIGRGGFFLQTCPLSLLFRKFAKRLRQKAMNPLRRVRGKSGKTCPPLPVFCVGLGKKPFCGKVHWGGGGPGAKSGEKKRPLPIISLWSGPCWPGEGFSGLKIEFPNGGVSKYLVFGSENSKG